MKLTDATLQAHKGQSSTTLTDLLLVGPLPDATYRGFSSLDVDVSYDNGDGAVTYVARTGVEMSALVSTSDLGVDNAEATNLAPVAGYEIEGFTQAEIDAGALDKTPFVVYRVNYKDLTAGRHEIIAGGTIGEQRTKNGQQTILELRSLSQQMKQSVGELDSLTCRAKFGSQVGEERFPCGFALAAEWVAGTIDTVASGEPDREFTCAALTQAADWFAPGVVEMLTGANAGQAREIEAFAGGIVGMQFPFVSALAPGDTFRIRRECSKRWSGHNSCNTFWATEKPNHFRGEPHIPVADTAKLNSPGAALSTGGVSGTGEA